VETLEGTTNRSSITQKFSTLTENLGVWQKILSTENCLFSNYSIVEHVKIKEKFYKIP